MTRRQQARYEKRHRPIGVITPWPNGRRLAVMAAFAPRKGSAALLLVLVLMLFGGRAAKRRSANLDGYVFDKCLDFKLVGPVAGAVISTSVDRTTASTDAAGHFHLLTHRPVFSDERHEVSVDVGDVRVDDHITLPQSSPVRLAFVLSPPERVFAVRDYNSGQMSCHPFPFRHTLAKRGK